MYIKNFKDLEERFKQNRKSRGALVAAQDENALGALIMAKDFCDPICFGAKSQIENILIEKGEDPSLWKIVDCKDEEEAAQKAVQAILENQADFIIKGKISSPLLLKAVVQKENGLRNNKLMSHVALLEVPSYHKILGIVDGGMVLEPTLEEKIQILENTLEVFHALSYKEPKVAVLSAMDQVSPYLPETQDAHGIKVRNQRGEIQGCVVEGPISYDLAINKNAAKIKGFVSPVAGDADILLVPHISTGNILAKALYESAGGKMAGIIVGAKAPIVLNSRGATKEEKYYSIVLASSFIKNS